MSNKQISETISVYLQSFADAPYPKQPEPPRETAEILRENPVDAFNLITSFLLEKPTNLDPRDLDDPLCRLLSTFADLVPDLMIPKMTEGYWGGRYLYISSAALSKAPVFIPTIIDLLTDRSIYIKYLILDLLVRLPHLQVPEAMPQLEKLSKMKSIQKSERERELVKKAIRKVSMRSTFSLKSLLGKRRKR